VAPRTVRATSRGTDPARVEGADGLGEALFDVILFAHRSISAGNSYEVDPTLVGRKVELFDPFDLTRIEVRLAGAPMGLAIPHHIGRHSASQSQTRNPFHTT
jgi:hypothetical protein